MNKRDKIRQLNDEHRKMHPKKGHIYCTQGICSLVNGDHVKNAALFLTVSKYDDFSQDNDPYGEHDFGAFDFEGEKCFWKIDYYDKELKYGSEDPSNPEITERVLTIMLASEY